MPPENPLLAFRRRFEDDRRTGRRPHLEDYLGIWPGHAEEIGREYGRLCAAEAGIAVSAGSGTGTEAGATGGIASDDGSRAAAPGRSFGPYRVISILGRGGQATVYLAEDTRLPRRVALKVLGHAGPEGEEMLRRFLREAELTSKLDHPGIGTVYEAGLADGTPFIAMRLVEGETLARKIQTAPGADAAGGEVLDIGPPSGSVPDDERTTPARSPATTTGRAGLLRVVRLVEKSALAIHAAHEAGVIHRDLKPGNIMVTPDGEPVVLDFGLAFETGSDGPGRLTETGARLGTPAYMAPEQIEGRVHDVDRRTDVYALGVVLYEALTLRPPYAAASREALYRLILRGDPVDPRRRRPRIPADLAAVCLKAMAKDPARRYASAAALADDLGRVRRREPTACRPPSPARRLLAALRRHPRIATIALLFLGASGGVAWHRASRQEVLDDTAEAVRAFHRCLGSWQDGQNAPPDSEAVVKGFVGSELLAYIRTHAATEAAWEEFMAGVREKLRSGEDIDLLEPRAGLTDTRPVFRFRPGGIGAGAGTGGYQVTVIDGAGLRIARWVVPAGKSAANGVIAALLPEGVALDPGPGGRRTYLWKVTPSPGPGATESDPLSGPAAAFEVVAPGLRERALTAIKPTGSDTVDRQLRAFALLRLGLAAEARAGLSDGPPSADPEGLRVHRFLAAWAAARLGDRETAERLHASGR